MLPLLFRPALRLRPAFLPPLLLLLLLLALPPVFRAEAHSGDDHDHGPASAPAHAGLSYFTTSASSPQFELVLRYEPLHGGEPATLRLFVADFATNVPIRKARLQLTAAEDPAVRFTATEQAPGDYRLTGSFPRNRTYGLAAQVVAPDGRADLLLLPGIAVGKELPAAEEAAAAPVPWLTWKTGLVLLAVFLAGMVLAAWLLRRRSSSPSSSSVTP